MLLAACSRARRRRQARVSRRAARRGHRQLLRHGGRRPVPLDGRRRRAADHGWVKAEGDLTRSYLDAIPQRTAIRDAYRKLIDYEKVGAPYHQGQWWFFSRNTGLQNQSVLYVRRGEHGTPRVLLDPNTLAADGTVALAGSVVHARRQLDGVRDAVVGRRLADVARQGRRDGPRPARHDPVEQVLRRGVDRQRRLLLRSVRPAQAGRGQRDAQRARRAEDVLPQARNAAVRGPAGVHRAARSVHRHRAHRRPALRLHVSVAKATATASRGSAPASRSRRSSRSSRSTRTCSTARSATTARACTCRRTCNAPRGRLAWLDLNDPAHALHDIVPQSADAMEGVSLLGNRFYVSYLHDAHSVVKIYALDGKPAGSIDLPGIGSGGQPGGHRADRIVYYGFTSYTYPTTIYRYDTQTGKSTVAIRPKIAFDPSAVRHRADLHDVQGRHAHPGVRDAPQGHAARRLDADDPVRLRRVQHLDHAGLLVLDRAVAADGRRVRGRDAARRRRVRRRVARRRPARQQAARVRRLHRGGADADRQEDHARRRSSRRTAVPTAACWSAPRSPSGPTCSARRSRRSACSTCCASRSSPSARRG